TLRLRSFPTRRSSDLGVRRLANVHRERHLAQEGDAQPCGFGLRAAVAEDVVVLAGVGGDEVAHVLDDAEQWHLDPAEHVQPLARSEEHTSELQSRENL